MFAVLVLALLYAVLASTFILAKIALEYSPPIFLIGVRMILGGGLLLWFYRFVLGKKISIASRDRWLFFQTALFHIYITYILEFWALQYMAASKTILIYATTPFIGAFIAHILYSERLRARQWLGMVVGLASLFPVVVLAQAPGELNGQLWNFSFPEVVLFGAVISASYAWFLVKGLMERGYSLVMINGSAMVMGGGLALVTAFFVEGVYPLAPGAFWPFLFWNATLILTANFFVYNLYAWLMHKHSITTVMVASFLTPIFGVIMGYLFLGEPIPCHYGVSLAGVALGMWLFYKA